MDSLKALLLTLDIDTMACDRRGMKCWFMLALDQSCLCIGACACDQLPCKRGGCYASSGDIGGAQVVASKGHIVELESKHMGVDPSDGYALEWALLPRKKQDLQQVQEAAKGARAIILATDPDREGEGISWHLLNHLQVCRPSAAETDSWRCTISCRDWRPEASFR